MHATTTAHRKLDGTTPSPELTEPVLAHLRMATRMRAQIWDPASAHVQTREVGEVFGVAIAAVDLAAQTQSERVLSRARQFRRTAPAQAPHGLLRDFDERLYAANTQDRAFE